MSPVDTLTNPNHLKPKQEFARAMNGAQILAGNAYPYLQTRSIWDINNNIHSRDIPECAQAAATMLLTMPNAIRGLSDSSKRFDPSVSILMHESIASLMKSVGSIEFTRLHLRDYCIRFCRENALLRKGEDIERFGDSILADINGVWHELNWENLILCTNTVVEHANRAEDLSGTDLWLDMGDDLDLAIDVKASAEAVRRHAKKHGLDITHEYKFSSNPKIEDSFGASLYVDSAGQKVYVVMENMPYCNNIAPIDFRGKKSEISTMQLLLDKLKELGPNGSNQLQLHNRVKSGKSLVHKPVRGVKND